MPVLSQDLDPVSTLRVEHEGNRGVVLRDMLDQGADSVGDPTQCHAVAIDGRAPKFDGGIVTRLDCVPFSIVVNRDGNRFYDEGEDVWPKRYVIWGRLVAAQPDQVTVCDPFWYTGTSFAAILLSLSRRLSSRVRLPDGLPDWPFFQRVDFGGLP